MFFQLGKVSYALLLYKHVIFFLNPLGGCDRFTIYGTTPFFLLLFRTAHNITFTCIVH